MTAAIIFAAVSITSRGNPIIRKENQNQMADQKFLTEGILNQFGKSIYRDIPALLAEMCSDFFDVEEETSKIVEKHLIDRIYLSDTTYYEQIKTPGRDTTKKLDKRRRYQMAKLLDSLHQDYESVLRGENIKDPSSPYNSYTLDVLQSLGDSTREQTVEMVAKKINAFCDTMLDAGPRIRGGSGEVFHGFYEYPYFRQLAITNEKTAEKLLHIDLEEFVIQCASSTKYNQFVSYPADSVSRGFYGEIIRSKKEDAEYEVITTQYLQNTFFPEERGIEHVKIISEKPWDLKDMSLFGYLCNCGVTKLLQIGLTSKSVIEVEGTIHELCKVLYPESKSFGAKSYSLVRARLTNMINTKLEAVTTDGRKITQWLFDRVTMDNYMRSDNDTSEGVPQGGLYQARLGWSLTEDVLSHRLSTIIKPNIAELKNPASVVIYAPLKKDRAVDLCLYDLGVHEYSLISLLLMYRVDAKKKATRLERYSEVFTELKEKGLLIKDFSVSGSKFVIEWMPLSPEEKRDIRVLKKGTDAVIDVTPDK